MLSDFIHKTISLSKSKLFIWLLQALGKPFRTGVEGIETADIKLPPFALYQ